MSPWDNININLRPRWEGVRKSRQTSIDSRAPEGTTRPRPADDHIRPRRRPSAGKRRQIWAGVRRDWGRSLRWPQHELHADHHRIVRGAAVGAAGVGRCARDQVDAKGIASGGASCAEQRDVT